jgi:hypothetical protein
LELVTTASPHPYPRFESREAGATGFVVVHAANLGHRFVRSGASFSVLFRCGTMRSLVPSVIPNPQ